MLTDKERESLKVGDIVYFVIKDHSSFRMYVDEYKFSHSSKNYLNFIFGSFKITKSNNNNRLFSNKKNADNYILQNYKIRVLEMQNEIKQLEQDNGK